MRPMHNIISMNSSKVFRCEDTPAAKKLCETFFGNKLSETVSDVCWAVDGTRRCPSNSHKFYVCCAFFARRRFCLKRECCPPANEIKSLMTISTNTARITNTDIVVPMYCALLLSTTVIEVWRSETKHTICHRIHEEVCAAYWIKPFSDIGWHIDSQIGWSVDWLKRPMLAQWLVHWS